MAPGRSRVSADIRRHPRTLWCRYGSKVIDSISDRGSRLLAPGGLGYYRQGVPAGSWLAVDTFPLEGCSVTVNSAQIGM